MESIGARLRQRREQLGLTLEEAERVTRIRNYYLQALEEDDPGALPSPVQARGFLKNYADYLGLPTDELLRSYAESSAPKRASPRAQVAPTGPAPTRPRTPAAKPRSLRPRWFSADLLVAAVISIGTLALLVWGGGRLMASLRQRTEQAEESAFLIPTPTGSPTPAATQAPLPTFGGTPASPEATPATPTLPPLPLPSGRVVLRLIAEQRAWIRVLIDGRLQFQGRIAPGDVLDYTADRVLEVSTGNGAGVRITWNGEDQGLMGGLDEVVTRLWTAVAVLTPTPTVSPTGTGTAVPSPTVAPTATSAPAGVP
ncbi:MAG TPA: RodZ domain-containing protein [Anaerolineales bacterium]|nr:RodZ domain-containing protein [Anaerolineales bacterium]